MKNFDYSTAVNQLGLDKKSKINKDIRYDLIPSWARGKSFLELFLPYLRIKIDSREQDHYIENACKYFGIDVEIAKKDKKMGTENLKEGDITFEVIFGEKVFDYTNIACYERKGSANEWYNNIMKDRDRLNAEMKRQVEKGYKKFVLLLEIGNCLYDLIDYQFFYYNNFGDRVDKSLGTNAFATVLSWCQNNHFGIELLQVDTQKGKKEERFNARMKLFFLMLYDMFYFFRQELRLDCITKGLIENHDS